MPDLKIEYLAIAELKPNPRNARVHSEKQLHPAMLAITGETFAEIADRRGDPLQ